MNENDQDYIKLPKLLTISQAAVYLGLTDKALRNRIDRGSGPKIIRLGPKTIRIKSSDLEAFIDECSEKYQSP